MEFSIQSKLIVLSNYRLVINALKLIAFMIDSLLSESVYISINHKAHNIICGFGVNTKKLSVLTRVKPKLLDSSQAKVFCSKDFSRVSSPRNF